MTATLSERDRVAIERWLLRRGVPHLIHDYSVTEDVLTRALPAFVLLFLVELTGAFSKEWTMLQNAAAGVGAFVFALGLWAAVNRARGRRSFARPGRVGRIEVAVFLFVPALVTAAFGQPLQGLLLIGFDAALLAVIVFATSYGVVPLVRWVVVRMFRELGELLGLLSRALPLLLLFVTFLFINTEVWQVSDALEWELLVATVLLFVVLGGGFVGKRLPTELERLAHFDDDAEVDRLCEGTPAAAVAAAIDDLDQVPLQLTKRQRINLYLVVVLAQGIQVTLVAVLLFAFFIVFGLVAIRPDVIEAWVGEEALREALVTLTLRGHDIVLTPVLLRVSVVLASFSAFYFTVYAVTDATYREQFFDDMVAEVRQTLAVRTAYLAAFGRD